MTQRANAARDAKQYREAAILYQEAARFTPDRAGILIQCGHMFKECGDYTRAESHYERAAKLTPDDADLALQLGHFYKVTGRYAAARASYARALALKPSWEPPTDELRRLDQAGHRDAQDADEPAPDDIEGLVPDLVPRKAEDLTFDYGEHVSLRRCGHREETRWGRFITFRGIESIRGFAAARTPVVGVEVYLSNAKVYSGPVRKGTHFANAVNPERVKRYAFNIWLETSGFERGRHKLEIRLTDTAGRSRSHFETVVVLDPLPADSYSDSDSFVPSSASGLSPEAQVAALPSEIRPADRFFLRQAPRKILVQRTDQLGDMVTSIPAMRRLRELAPQAHIVGLLTEANAEFARTLGLFDEVIVVDFPDDPVERRRVMTLARQAELAARLRPYAFDLAIDLAESYVSRPLLRLSGAKVLAGAYDRDWPFLAVGYEGNTHDPLNGLESAPHSAKVLALVERLGPLFKSNAETLRRADLGSEQLRTMGLEPDARFVILHTGARIAFSRWPHYVALAEMILERTDLTVVVLTDDPAMRAKLGPALCASDRVRVLDRRLAFDEFDALLSFCSGFVGNDSGPKHLASLRGANVVSIHCARINWNEWGQEHGGVIISRRVPCAGCNLFHDADECAKDFVCVTQISPEEVFGALRDLIDRPSRSDAA